MDNLTTEEGIKEILVFSFRSLKDRKMLLLIGAQFILQVLLIIGILALLYSVFYGFIAGNNLAGLTGDALEAAVASFLLSGQLVSLIIMSVSGLAVLLLVYQIFYYILLGYIENHALALRNLSPKPFSLSRFPKLLLTGIYRFFFMYFYSYNSKLRIANMVFAAIFLLAFLGIVAFALSANWLLLLFPLFAIIVIIIPWSVLATYQYFRLMFAPMIYLQTGMGVRASCRRSWEMTRGKLISVVVPLIVLAVIKILITIALVIIVAIPLFAALAVMKTDPAISLNLIDLARLPVELLLAPIFLAVDALAYAAIFGHLLNSRTAPPA